MSAHADRITDLYERRPRDDDRDRGRSPQERAVRSLLAAHGFVVDAFVPGDSSCGGHAIWLCGLIGFRWQPGTEALPPTCLGHIGYTVVPWKRRLGYATQALAAILDEARAEGLRYIEISTDPGNVPSQRVITSNGGVLVEEFTTPASLGGKRQVRFRVPLTR